eukprot:3868603-Prymnesium_polylepis.1
MAHVRVAPAQGWRRFDLGRAGHRRGGTGLERGFECQLSATGATRAEHRKLGWSRRCPGPTTR